MDEDRSKDRFKNCELCGLWNVLFCGYETMKLHDCFANACFKPLLCRSSLPSLANTTRSCFTCSIRWRGFLEERHTSVFLVQMFIQAWSHVVENRSSTWCDEDPVQRMQAAANRPERVDPTYSNSDTLVYAVSVYPIHIDRSFPTFLSREPILKYYINVWP